ncbi:hypothetical protein AU190_19570 [Mycolicibacterium acapulense]|nr:hypothetical protein AU191_23410 [Mycolicibacterium acapulense]KUI10342.1 hypothetical protein AU190_19570 [Mycolicibacterium acapulense]
MGHDRTRYSFRSVTWKATNRRGSVFNATPTNVGLHYDITGVLVDPDTLEIQDVSVTEIA